MFNKLRERLKSWTKSFSKKVEESKEKEDEKKEEEKIPGKPGFFKRIFSKITKVKISEKDFDVYAEELEFLLLENNVALEVVEKVIEQLKKQIVGKEILKKEVESE